MYSQQLFVDVYLLPNAFPSSPEYMLLKPLLEEKRIGTLEKT
jgi:hypothetical protein